MNVIDDEIWVEKYRPKTIDEIAGNEKIKKLFKAFIERGNIPHLIMYGEPSTGKTSSALALSNEFFGESMDNNFKELNASDERGIDVVRTKIKNFAKTKPMNSFNYNIMFLDEMDALTPDAQAALRRTMEQYSSNCRFILSCNYMNKVISPLQSRGLPLYFAKMSVEDMAKYVDMICEKEGITIDEEVKISLIKNYNIDARKILNALQACSFISNQIDSNLLSSLMKIPSQETVRQMITFAIDGNYDKSSEILLSEFINNGFDGITILNNIYEIFKEFKDSVDSTMFIKINQVIGRTEVALNEGNTPYIQLDALLSDMSMLGQITPSCPVRGC